MNAYLAEIIAAQRMADLRREADHARLVAAAQRPAVKRVASPRGSIAPSLVRLFAVLRRRTA